MQARLTSIIVLMTYGELVHAEINLRATGYSQFSGVDHGVPQGDLTDSLRVVAVTLLFDIPPSAHDCNQDSSFYTVRAAVNLTVPNTSTLRSERIRRGGSFTFQVWNGHGAKHKLVTLRRDISFKNEGASYCLKFKYRGKIGNYPGTGLIRTSCSEERRPRQSPIVTYYGPENQMDSFTSIVPTIPSGGDSFAMTVSIKKRGTRHVIFGSDFTASSASEKNESVTQVTHETSCPACNIFFSIGNFKEETKSVTANISMSVVRTAKSKSYITGFVMNEAANMAATMEENFGKNLVNTDLCFLMTFGTNVFKAGAHLIVIGIEGAAKNSAFILWRLVRETIIMRWFDIPTATNIEKMAVNGAISFLAGSLVGEGRKNIDETWISTMIAKQLGDSLPVEMNERMLYKTVNTRSNEVSPGYVMEMVASLIGVETIKVAFNTFLLDIRQNGTTSLLTTLDRILLQRGKMDWCGRPFKVTDFFVQWMEKTWPKPGVPVTKFLLHIVIADREKFQTVPQLNYTGAVDEYPPVPVFLKSLEDSLKSVIWRSQGQINTELDSFGNVILKESHQILNVLT